MEDPLSCLSRHHPPKSSYKEYVTTKIVSFHERELRHSANNILSMKYFNVSLLSLRGKPQPSISDVYTSNEIQNMRPHIKLLSGDYLTYKKKSRQSGGDPRSRYCIFDSGESESVSHIVKTCDSLQSCRYKMISELTQFCNLHNIFFDEYLEDSELFTQFLLDASSMNLPN